MERSFGQAASERSSHNRFVFVGDIDNLSHTETGARGFVDIPRFVSLLRRRGVTEGVAVANRFSALEARLWEGAGFACVATGCNADDQITRIISSKVEAGAERIMIGSGDGRAFADLVQDLTAEGVPVHVLANRNSLSHALAAAATGYAYTDAFVYPPVGEAA